MMKPRYTNSHDEHHVLSQLLPWYVNKSLKGAELNSVEEHLSFCLTCKRDLIQLQKIAQAVVQEDSRDSAAQIAFGRLKSRLHNQPSLSENEIKQNQNNNQMATIPAIKDSYKKHNRLAVPVIFSAMSVAAALLLSISLLAPNFAGNDLPLINDYKTLSDGQQERTNASEIRVVFAKGVGQEQKSKILEQIHGSIIGSPTAQGVYTVRLGEEISAKQTLDSVDTLRRNSQIIFAEPSYSLLSSMANN